MLTLIEQSPHPMRRRVLQRSLRRAIHQQQRREQSGSTAMRRKGPSGIRDRFKQRHTLELNDLRIRVQRHPRLRSERRELVAEHRARQMTKHRDSQSEQCTIRRGSDRLLLVTKQLTHQASEPWIRCVLRDRERRETRAGRWIALELLRGVDPSLPTKRRRDIAHRIGQLEPAARQREQRFVRRSSVQTRRESCEELDGSCCAMEIVVRARKTCSFDELQRVRIAFVDRRREQRIAERRNPLSDRELAHNAIELFVLWMLVFQREILVRVQQSIEESSMKCTICSGLIRMESNILCPCPMERAVHDVVSAIGSRDRSTPDHGAQPLAEDAIFS